MHMEGRVMYCFMDKKGVVKRSPRFLHSVIEWIVGSVRPVKQKRKYFVPFFFFF